MKKAAIWVLAIVLVVSLTACASKEKKIEDSLDRPVDCTNAEGDIRVLKSEKEHADKQVQMGIASILPPAAIMALLTDTYGTQVEIASGDYNEMLDKRIKKIQETCGIE